MEELVEYECVARHTCNHKGGLSSEGGILCEARTPEKCPYARKVVPSFGLRADDCSMKY